MGRLSKEKYNELFRLRASGKLEPMECTKSLFKVMERYYTSGMSVLDIPCGTGHYYKKIKELGPMEYIGIDMDEGALLIATDVWKNALHANFMKGNINNIPLDNNSQDIVYCHNLLLHLRDYKKPISELFRVSKRYIFIRSLFDKETVIRESNTPKDYKGIFPKKSYYNTYNIDEVLEFIKSLGKVKMSVLDDNGVISVKQVREQAVSINAEKSKLTQSNSGKQEWDGIDLNYKLIIIEKEI